LQKISVGFTNTWLKQLRDYRTKLAICELKFNLLHKQYGSLKLSNEEKVQYEKAISVFKQQAALFLHIVEQLPVIQKNALIQRYGQSDKSADPLQVKEAGKELLHILKAMYVLEEIELIITAEDWHIIRWKKPVKASKQLTEDDADSDELDEPIENDPVARFNYYQHLMETRER
jgi:hypothetical protein